MDAMALPLPGHQLDQSQHAVIPVHIWTLGLLPCPHVGVVNCRIKMAVLGELDVAAKLAEFEELFKYRYTEKDDGYREALRRGSR